METKKYTKVLQYLLSILHLSAHSWEAQTKSIEIQVAVILLSSRIKGNEKLRIHRCYSREGRM